MVGQLFTWLFRGGVGSADEVAAAANAFCEVWPINGRDGKTRAGLELGFPELRGYLSRYLRARHPIEAANVSNIHTYLREIATTRCAAAVAELDAGRARGDHDLTPGRQNPHM